MNLFSYLLDAILPPHEDVRRARLLSPEKLAALVSPRAAALPWITALLPYREAHVRALIRAIKYHGETRALTGVGEYLGEYLIESIAEKRLLDGWGVPLLIAIPSSARKLRARGYNQAERILEAALPALGGAGLAAPRVLAREERQSQVEVLRAERAANIHGAFFVPDSRAVRGKEIILIDDVTESGATLADARRALLSAGARDVIAVALAH